MRWCAIIKIKVLVAKVRVTVRFQSSTVSLTLLETADLNFIKPYRTCSLNMIKWYYFVQALGSHVNVKVTI